MAKATTAKAPKKVKKAAAAKGTKAKVKVKAAGGKKGAKKANPKSSQGFDALAKLADHPLVGELLAVGAMAAVAAIAAEGFKGKGKGRGGASTKAVKDAGKAAAAAIGKRLIAEFEAVKKAAKPSKAKS